MDDLPVKQREYKEHKNNCSVSFNNINSQLELLNQAMFGKKELHEKGVYDMTKQLYDSMKMAKGGEQVFWMSVKIAGGVTVLISSFWVVYEALKRITIN